MKNYKKQIKLIGIFCVIITFFGCVKDQDYSSPIVECVDSEISITNTIQQVKEMYTFGRATVIDTDVIIEGYVVSNDKSGNIYKSISIQDKPENPTSAIKISIDQTNLYTKYNVGRKIYIKLKGLGVGYSFGSIQIGQVVEGELTRISTFEVDKRIFRSCEIAEVIPKKVSVSELNKELLEMLIEIEDVQFKTSNLGMSYGNIDNTLTVNRVLESFDSNCSLIDELIVRNSGYSKFKNELLPKGKGSVIGVFGNFYDDFQLYLRDLNDVKFTDERCEYSNAFSPNITILEVKEMYDGDMVEFGIENNYIIEGFVISSDEHGNFKEKLVIQDAIENPTAGIQVLIKNETIYEDFNIGDKVFIKLDKLYMAENDGVLTVGYPTGNKITNIKSSDMGNFIYNSGENYEIKPKEISISEVLNKEHENTLVNVLNVQLIENQLGKAFANFTGSDDGIRTLETCGEITKLGVYTNGDATFVNSLFPKGHGSIIGVLSSLLELRSIHDINFNEDFEPCPVIIPKIMITEIADPKNSTSSRFVELFNAGNTEINLSNWRLNKYINGTSTFSSSPIDLTGKTIAPGAFLIIANTGYAASFGEMPGIGSTYISGNGDDVYELVNNLDETIDVFGIIGEDGNGKNWEYLDGRAVRKMDVVSPNHVFSVSEWVIYSSAANSLISNPNSPQNAPDDFNPGNR